MQANSVLKMLREHAGNDHYHPLCSLLDLAGDEDASVPDRINIHKSIAKYTEQELRSVEVRGATSEPIRMSINIDGEQL